MLAERLRHFDLRALQNAEKLECVDDGFALVVVVGDEERVSGVFADGADARDPGIELLRSVEIVVTFVRGRGGVVVEPGVVAAAVEADVTDGRGGVGGRLQGVADNGLVDVAESCLVIAEELQCVWSLPGGMAEFDDERIVREASKDRGEINDGFGCFVKRERELQQYGAEFVCLLQYVEAGAHGAFVFF